MVIMNNFKISTRLIILISLLSALLIAIGSMGLFGINQSNAALKTVYEDRTVPMGQIAEIQSNLLEDRLAVADSLVTPTPHAHSRGNHQEHRRDRGQQRRHRQCHQSVEFSFHNLFESLLTVLYSVASASRFKAQQWQFPSKQLRAAFQ